MPGSWRGVLRAWTIEKTATQPNQLPSSRIVRCVVGGEENRHARHPISIYTVQYRAKEMFAGRLRTWSPSVGLE